MSTDEFAEKVKQTLSCESNAKLDILKEEASELRKLAATLTERYNIRRAKDMVRKAECLEETISLSVAGQCKDEEIQKMLNVYVACSKKQRDPCNTVSTTKQNASGPTFLASREKTNKQDSGQFLISNKDSCTVCNEPLRLVACKAIMACSTCGYATTYLDATSSSMSYGDEIDFSNFSYKRINHFNEWLQQIQGKETYEVPMTILKSVMRDLHAHRVLPDQVTQSKVREALKRLKLRKSYENVVQITARITGNAPKRLTHSMEELCRAMFMTVQPAFEKHCPANRKNFLSYSYCLFKFLQLIGCSKLMQSCSLLKGRDKLQKQDEIFKGICEELDWEFIPSI
eukprot:6008794-Pleurochrysis_carterae.AAC.2